MGGATRPCLSISRCRLVSWAGYVGPRAAQLRSP